MTFFLHQVKSSQILSRNKDPGQRAPCTMEKQINCWTGTQEVYMQCSSTQRFPCAVGHLVYVSMQFILYLAQQRQNFPSAWSLQTAVCLGRSGSHSEHLFSAYSSRTLVLLSYQDDMILLFEDTNSSMRKDTSEGSKQPQHKEDKDGEKDGYQRKHSGNEISNQEHCVQSVSGVQCILNQIGQHSWKYHRNSFSCGVDVC